MTWSLVGSAGTVVNSTTSPVTVNCGQSSTAGNLLVMVVEVATGTSQTVTTPSGWTLRTSVSQSGSQGSQVWIFDYLDNPGSISSVSLTWSAGTGKLVAQILEFTCPGAALASADQTGTANNTSPSSPFDITTGGNCAASNELAVTGTCLNLATATTVTLGAGSGFTLSGSFNNGSSTTGHFSIDYDANTGSSSGSTVTDAVTLSATGSGGIAGAIATYQQPAAPGTAAFPANPLPVVVEILLNGTWTDISSFVYQRDTIQISGGTSAQGSTSQPAQCQMTLNNRDGRFSPNNTSGAYYPYLTRNIQLRVSVQGATSSQSATYTGYRFWGTVPEWPPTSDVSGQDVYIQITANGPLRQINQGGEQASPLFRYYENLALQDANNGTNFAPIAYWPVEDDTNSLIIGSGINGGTDMSVATGTPLWKATSDFPGSGPVARINKSTWTGVTSSFGSSGDDVFDTPGTYQWIASTTTVNCRVWGAGGGGTNGDSAHSGSGGNGGGGGEFAQETTLAVTPGHAYTVVVGAGGADGHWSAGGSAGGTSSFAGDSVTVTAHGGAGATASGNSGGSAAGGTGSTNTVHHNGGTGGFNSATWNRGSGGGGSGGASGAGGNGGNATSSAQGAGGSAGSGTPSGAVGGQGSPVDGTDGQSGRLPGGGGGGGYATNVDNTMGGNGASGQVELLYAAAGGGTGGSQVLTSGSQWVAPTGVSSVKVECVGGGGGSSTDATGGGGGGEYAAEASVAVTPGSIYSFSIGAGGTPGNNANAGAGGNTTFTGDSTTVTAHGGAGGQFAVSTNAAGGSGSTNTTHHPGGQGGSGQASGPEGGPGGGSSGGNAASGNAGANTTGGNGAGGAGGAAPAGGGAGGTGDSSACVDTATQILTRRGWLNWDEVAAGDAAWTTSGWQDITRVHVHEGTFKVVRFTGAISAVSTLNHRWPTQRGYVTTADLEPSDVLHGGITVGGLGRAEDEITGTVWCVTSAGGNWLSRRDGTEYFTGNKPDGTGHAPGGGAGAAGTGGSTGYSGAKGQITLTWTGGVQPPWNILRFCMETPSWGIFPNNSVLIRMLTTGTIARVDVIASTGGNIKIQGKNSGGTTLFTSSNLTVGDGTPLMVSVELTNSGTSVAWKLTAINPNSGPSGIGNVTGTQASAQIGSVSEVIVCPNADITKTVVGQVSVQYNRIDLINVISALNGHDTEMSIDRFIRLCNELNLNANPQFAENSDHWGFETGTNNWSGSGNNCTVAQSASTFTPLVNGTYIFSSWPPEGSHSLKVTSSATGAFNAFSPTATAPPVNPGDIVTAGCEVYVPSAINDAYMFIRWFDDTGAQIIPDTDSTPLALASGTMQSLTVKGTAPANAASFNIHVGDNDASAGSGTVMYVDNVRVTPQMGKQTRDNYRAYLQQVEDLDQGMLKEDKDIYGLKYRTRYTLINQSPAVVLDYSQNQLGGDYAGTLLAPVFDDKLTVNSLTVHRNGGSQVSVSLDNGTMSTQLPPKGVGKQAKQVNVVATDDNQLIALATHLLNLGTVTDESYPDIPVDLARSELAATGLFDTIPNLEVGDYIQIVNLPDWFPSATVNQLIVGYTETLNALQWDIDFNCVPESPYEITATDLRRW